MSGELVITTNRKAFHDYEILERYEAGIALTGTEVKSIRAGRINLKDSYARVVEGELWLEGCHISPYSHGNLNNHEPERPRKLLLHRREIARLIGATTREGLTIVPLRVYLKRGKVKVELGLAKGKKAHDKRETLRRRTIEREIAAEMKRR
ncbi:MAG: SsrA-binding protein SmpB [Acidobacteriota bacterium]